jgi:hypothetical protein
MVSAGVCCVWFSSFARPSSLSWPLSTGLVFSTFVTNPVPGGVISKSFRFLSFHEVLTRPDSMGSSGSILVTTMIGLNVFAEMYSSTLPIFCADDASGTLSAAEMGDVLLPESC